MQSISILGMLNQSLHAKLNDPSSAFSFLLGCSYETPYAATGVSQGRDGATVLMISGSALLAHTVYSGLVVLILMYHFPSD